MRENLPSGRKLLVMEMQTRDSRFYEQQLARMHVGTLVSIAGNKATVQLQGRTIEQAIMHGYAEIGTAVTVFYSGNYAIVIGKDEAEGGNGGGGSGYLPLTGGTMTGPISLPAPNPTVPTQAAHKGYVDSAVAASAAADDAKFLKLTGGTLTGALTLSGAPTNPNHAATKAYVDSFVGTGPFLPLAGGTMTGPIVLSANPSLAMHATPKQYVDLRLPLVGGTMTGFIVLHADPSTAMQAATKQYVDTKAPVGGPYLPLSGGTMSGAIAMGGFHITGLPATPVAADQAVSKGHADAIAATLVAKAGSTMTGLLILSADPAVALGAATKQYVDAKTATGPYLPLAGGVMTGAITLPAAMPTVGTQAADKGYVDQQDALKLALAGGTMSGFITLHSDPTATMHAVTKQYVDSKFPGAGFLPLAGGTMTGFITLHSDPSSAMHAATKQYADTKAASGHNHDAAYSPVAHAHAGVYLPLTGGLLTGALNIDHTVQHIRLRDTDTPGYANTGFIFDINNDVGRLYFFQSPSFFEKMRLYSPGHATQALRHRVLWINRTSRYGVG